ncbi:ThiF family adenylyltransferase [Candidatus Woesearchaeota archaeon]|nr:ThiF family adenylyltransferase [Candidatus Woesearchaeota archaeon]
MATLEMQGTGSSDKVKMMYYAEEFRQLMSGIYRQEELQKIKDASISISGVGGSAGSYLLDILVRKGFETFNLAEPDIYDLRNLSRQLFANTQTIGRPKLDIAVEHALRINPQLTINCYASVDAENAEDFTRSCTVMAYQAEGFSAWALTRYMCSRYKIPFVNVSRKRKGNLRSVIATTVFDYRDGEPFTADELEFDSFGIQGDLARIVKEMFIQGRIRQDLLDECDRVHNEFKKKRRFTNLGDLYPEVGPITDRYPDDYFKRYSDPEICLIAGALAARTITDLVVNRITEVRELDIFSRKSAGQKQ